MTVCVHGLGYIGLSTAAMFANNEHEVVGYDTDPELRTRLQSRDFSTTEPSLTRYVERALADGFDVRDAPTPADYHVICVPTPFDREAGEADLQHVDEVGRTVSELIRPDDVVVLESTVPPGTTETRLAPILAQSGHQPGSDFGVGYTPETVLPGNTVRELLTNDRIVGGINRASRNAVVDLFDPLTTGTVHRAPDATTAEFVKLVQNAFRYVNIAYANALALLADDYGIDVWDSIDMANSHPRVDILSPGPGVGGHCLPVDPLFLCGGSDRTELIDSAKSTNDQMPAYVANRLRSVLNDVGGSTVAVLGIAYKGNVADTRNSPGLAVAQAFKSQPLTRQHTTDGGWNPIKVRLTDPCVSDDHHDLVSLESALVGADAAVITAGHDEYAELDPQKVKHAMDGDTIFDTLNILDTEHWSDAGLNVVRL